MVKGNDDSTLNLRTTIADNLGRLRVTGKIPKPFFVTVCTGAPKEVEGIMFVLRAWPRVRVLLQEAHYFINLDEMRTMTQNSHIVLIDENLGDFSPELFTALLKKHLIRSVIASVANNAKPDWATWHFGHKSEVMQSKKVTLGFIEFMTIMMFNELGKIGKP